MIKVLFICHGNICRSTMSQSVFADLVWQQGLETKYEIDSAATSREEIGNPPHHGTIRKLQQEGIPLVPHRARQMIRQDYDAYDYLIGMEHKIYKLLSFAGSDRDIADPWYTGDFTQTYLDVREGCEGLLHTLEQK